MEELKQSKPNERAGGGGAGGKELGEAVGMEASRASL